MPFNKNYGLYLSQILEANGFDLTNVSDEAIGNVVQGMLAAFRLSAKSPVDGRHGAETEDLENSSSEAGLIATRINVEAHYLIALSNVGVIRPLTLEEQRFLLEEVTQIDIAGALQVKAAEKKLNHDVQSMIVYLKERIKGTSLEDVVENIHYGLTSEDVNNLSVRLMLQSSIDNVLLPKVEETLKWLVDKAEEFKELAILGRTHGQPAVGTTWGKELIYYAERLDVQIQKLKEMKLTGKLNGAVGNYNALHAVEPDVDWIQFSQEFVGNFDLKPNLITIQINPYEDMIETFQILSRINGILKDLNTDIWGYISDGWLIQEVLPEEVGSSAMGNKVNPINNENAEGNSEIANGLFGKFADVLAESRFQRDLTDSTVVRNVGVALSHSKVVYMKTLTGLRRARPNPEMMNGELNKNWSILAEIAQTLMRKYGVPDSYNIVKKLTRGVTTNQEEWYSRINALDIPEQCRAEILEWTPDNYLGLATELTEGDVERIRAQQEKRTAA